jgi:hypothetical protein
MRASRWIPLTPTVRAAMRGFHENGTLLTNAKVDYHKYSNPPWFTAAATMFDNFPRNGTHYFMGEYAG